jgi:signal peptidase II
MWVYLPSLVIILADQLSKFLARQFLPSGDSIPMISGVFHLTLVKNTGIAFGLLSGIPGFLMTFVIVLVLAIFVLSFNLEKSSRSAQLGLGFILGGAAGNLIDRLFWGHVTDFLDFRIWPVFNLADSFITVGVLIFLVLMVKR